MRSDCRICISGIDVLIGAARLWDALFVGPEVATLVFAKALSSRDFQIFTFPSPLFAVHPRTFSINTEGSLPHPNPKFFHPLTTPLP